MMQFAKSTQVLTSSLWRQGTLPFPGLLLDGDRCRACNCWYRSGTSALQAKCQPTLQATNAVTQPLVPLYAIDNITDGSPQTSTSLTQPAAENRILVQFNTPSPSATAPSELRLWSCYVMSAGVCAHLTC